MPGHVIKLKKKKEDTSFHAVQCTHLGKPAKVFQVQCSVSKTLSEVTIEILSRRVHSHHMRNQKYLHSQNTKDYLGTYLLYAFIFRLQDCPRYVNFYIYMKSSSTPCASPHTQYQRLPWVDCVTLNQHYIGTYVYSVQETQMEL